MVRHPGQRHEAGIWAGIGGGPVGGIGCAVRSDVQILLHHAHNIFHLARVINFFLARPCQLLLQCTDSFISGTAVREELFASRVGFFLQTDVTRFQLFDAFSQVGLRRGERQRRRRQQGRGRQRLLLLLGGSSRVLRQVGRGGRVGQSRWRGMLRQ